MREKNRFSSLLKHLMTVAKLKNYTLAKELQYDESYISKWVNGNLLPTEKTHEKVLRDISHCLVASLDDEGWEALLSEYQLTRRADLELAICDNLEAEYGYCIELKESTGSEIALKTSYYPELTLAQFMSKMHHPVLRQVKALDVIAALDILSLDRHYQLALAQLNSDQNVANRNYPNVHFSMLINLDEEDHHNPYNVTFLLNLLTSLTDISFQLFICPRAVGKLVFAVKDAYSISGMIIDENHCMAVTTSEDVKNSNAIYDRLKSLCSSENQVVRKTTMEYMIATNTYAQFLFARNQRWLLGHMTEHFVPEDLFEELAKEYCAGNPEADQAELRKAFLLSRSVMREMKLQMLIFENMLTDFAVSGELDFFNRKMTLTLEQRLRCLKHIEHMLSKSSRVEFKILRRGAITDNPLIPDPTLFLSDSLCYLRLVRSGPWNNVSVVNKTPIGDMFRDFFDEIWNSGKQTCQYDKPAIEELVRYVIQMVNVQLMSE